MNIAVIGAGYVGLVTGAGLADFGNDVICCDKNEERIADLKKGKIPIYEPGLDALVERHQKDGRLRFTTDLVDAIHSSRAIFIAVGTPQAEDGAANLSHVMEVAETIATHMNGEKLVITKSTVPVGTGRKIQEILDAKSTYRASVVSNPEFLREGSAIGDFMTPDRIVIGASDPESAELVKEIYPPHALEVEFVITNLESSELIKYAANGFLAMKISFINEVAALCERVGANVQDVAHGIGLDKRIGSAFLQAGPGFGGSCFPKDTKALDNLAEAADSRLKLISTVIEVNDAIKQRMVVKVREALGGDLRGKKIGILGLAFKPETDDMRDSPAITLIKGLQHEGALVRAYDPQAVENAREFFDNVDFCRDAYQTAADADALVIATEWNEFRALNLDRVKSLLRRPLIVDLRNIYELQRMKKEGFEYHSVGRLTVRPEQV